MAGPIQIRPGPASFARRTPADVREPLSQAGGREGDPWQVPTGDGGRISVRSEIAGDELQALELQAEGGAGTEREAMELAARLAERLNWQVVDPSGRPWGPHELRRRLRGGTDRLRSLLTVLGGVMAVVFGFSWAVERGLAPASLMFALLGLLLYAAMRTWGWLAKKLGSARGDAGRRTT